MRLGYPLWLLYTRKHWVVAIIRKHWIVAIIVVFIVLMALIFVGYQFDWTGFDGYTQVTTAHTISGPNTGTVVRTEVHQPGKSLWDWLQLLGVLAIPAVVGLGAAWYTAQQGKVSDRENKDNQRETALQAYIDKMSELLLKEKLRDSAEEDEVRKIARVRTLTVLRGLDPLRKASVLQFLYESGLIDTNKSVIYLDGAWLYGADLYRATLYRADLSGARLSGVKLFEADLREANLSKAHLRNADLRGAVLGGADLQGTNFQGAKYNTKEMQEKDVEGKLVTIMPTQWPQGFDPKGAGATCVEC